VLFLSTQAKDACFNAGTISKKLKVPKEFVSKVLQLLTTSGIVGSKKGKNGGFFLAKDPKKIRLIDIVETIDGLEKFNNCVLGFPGCNVGEPCPVHDTWGKLVEQGFTMLSEQTLDELKEKTLNKILDL
jgi:Rrf2 family protein